MEKHIQKSTNINILIQSSDKKTEKSIHGVQENEFAKTDKNFSQKMTKRFVQEANSYLPVRVTPNANISREFNAQDKQVFPRTLNEYSKFTHLIFRQQHQL